MPAAMLAPLRTSMLAALCLVAALIMYLHQQVSIQSGIVEQITAIGGDYDFLQLRFPFRDNISVVARHDLTQSSHVRARDLVVVCGSMTQTDGRTMLEAETIYVLPWTLPRLPDRDACLTMLASIPFVTTLLGFSALLGGPAAIRILTRLLVSAMSALIVWVGIQAAVDVGWVALPEKASVVLTILGGLIGWVLCKRNLIQTGSLLHRIATAGLLWLAMPLVEVCLDLPQGTSQFLIAASLFVPLLAYAALGASLITLGTAAHDGCVVGVVAAACAVVVFVVHFKQARDARTVAQEPPTRFRGLVPLSYLLKG